MKILLDSHVFLWAIAGDPRLSPKHRQLYESAESELYLSVAGCWEILLKISVGKLSLPTPVSVFLMQPLRMNRISLLPIRPSHFEELEALPPVHRDPFDRMIVAQTRAESMPSMTADEAMSQYSVEVV